MKDNALISVRGLEKSFGKDIQVLKGIDIDIFKGDVVVVLGPSGSGKSTFLRCLNRLEEPTGGHIFFEGTDITDPKVNINVHRQKMGMVFQQFNLFPHLTIKENIKLAPVTLKLMSDSEAEQKAMELLERVGLPDKAEASEHELRLITAFSDICAIEMQKHEFFVQKTGLQYETFLTELLEGRFNDVNIIETRLKLLNRRFGKFFCLAILYCPEPHNSDLFNKRQMTSLRQGYPNAMSVVYKNNIILLINQDTPVQLSPELTDPLEQFAERNHLKVSLSQPFADILKIRIFYHQALHTLELSDLQAPDQTLFYSTDALPEYLFSKCNYQELEVGIHYHIFQLQDYDKTYHTDFVETLRAYLDHDRNAAKTAEYLHIHRSTFFYRVKKIEELLEISISDSHLLFLYELSFKIWDYLCR